jgi:hypothetical protein
MLSFTRSGSGIVIIPLTDDSCVYMLSFTEVVLILLSFLSLMTAVYICSLLQEVVLILLSFLALMTAVYLFSFIGSGSHIVIIPLTDENCVYMFSFYRKWF